MGDAIIPALFYLWSHNEMFVLVFGFSAAASLFPTIAVYISRKAVRSTHTHFCMHWTYRNIYYISTHSLSNNGTHTL